MESTIEIPAPLVDRFRDRLRILAARRSGNAACADAVADDVLRRVVESAEGPGCLPEEVLQAGREICASVLDAEPVEGGDVPRADRFAGLVGEGRRMEIREVLARLEPQERALLEMYHGRGLAVSVIALNLGLGPAAVRTRRARVLQRLERDLGGVRSAQAGPGDAEQVPGADGCPGGDVARDYLHGRLAAGRADAFEEHFFACDRCWSELRRDLDLRQAIAGGAPADDAGAAPADSPTPPPVERPSRRGRLVGAAVLLALLAAAAAGARLLHGPRSSSRAAGDPDRSGQALAGPFALRLHSTPRGLSVTWPPAPGAEVYLLDLSAASGDRVWREETAAVSVVIPRESIPEGTVLYVRVRGRDGAGDVVADSGVQGISLLPRNE